ncbi:MAG: replication-relaxation family protein [Solirubrobacteraceae bacterium]
MPSHRYCDYATGAALAIAHKQGSSHARFQDVSGLLRHDREDYHAAAARACADIPDLQEIADFYGSELPAKLRDAKGTTAKEMDAPRNKISRLLRNPAMRRFYSHPTNVSLRSIIDARDILIVDANFERADEKNAVTTAHFLFRMLNRELYRLVKQPASKRPRVYLYVDEASHVAKSEHVVEQFAHHRAGGLCPTFTLQYPAQIGSGSVHQEKILRGFMNMLQSKFIFRLADHHDAEQAARAVMSVYQSSIRADVDARQYMRVTPEQYLHLPNHFCIGHMIFDGTPRVAFTGKTFPFPQPVDDTNPGGYTDLWARHHVERMAERCGAYPEDLGVITPYADELLNHDQPKPKPNRSRKPKPPAADATTPDNGNEPDTNTAAASSNGASSKQPSETHTPAPDPAGDPVEGRPAAQVTYQPPPQPPAMDDSPARRIAGQPAGKVHPAREDRVPAPESLRELALADRICEVGEPQRNPTPGTLARMYDEDYRVLAFLDKAGLAPTALIASAVMPDRTDRTMERKLEKLYDNGLIASHETTLRGQSGEAQRPPALYSLTADGLKTGQQRTPHPAIHPKREHREIQASNGGRVAHDLHALWWTVALHRAVGDVATDNRKTPRYYTGRIPSPHATAGARRRPITLADSFPYGQTAIDLQTPEPSEIKPDVTIELKAGQVVFDVLVELDLTERPAYNRDKLAAYDTFLCAWWRSVARYQRLAGPPIVVWVSRNERAMLALAIAADEMLTGRCGVIGRPPPNWYHAGRDHTFFAVEEHLHRGSLQLLALPELPPKTRQQRDCDQTLHLDTVQLIPATIAAAGRNPRKITDRDQEGEQA